MNNEITIIAPLPPARQADSDGQIIALWLHGRSPATQRAYGADVARFGAFLGKPLHGVTLQDLQRFADSISVLSVASQARVLSAVKSLFRFAHGLGFLPFDTAKPVRLPKIKDTLAERIIS